MGTKKSRRKGNKIKAKQLGMNPSTARARLLRFILFNFMEKLDQNKCYKCGDKMTVDSFSIEHKQFWLHVDPKLFWDLDNITFSHKSCNKPDRPFGREQND